MSNQELIKQWIDSNRIAIWEQVLKDLELSNHPGYRSIGLCLTLPIACDMVLHSGKSKSIASEEVSIVHRFLSHICLAVIVPCFPELEQVRPADVEKEQIGYWWHVEDIESRIEAVKKILNGLRNLKSDQDEK